jgi:WD40 repeat protein
VVLLLLTLREPRNGNLDVFTNDPFRKAIPLLAVRGALAGAVAGVAVGLSQWWLLRRVTGTGRLVQGTRASRWVAATSAGWTVAGALVITVSWDLLQDHRFASVLDQIQLFFSYAVAELLAGVTTGLGPGLLLRGRLPGSRRWVLSTVLGWAGGCAVSFAIPALVLWLTVAAGIQYDLAPVLAALFALQWVVAGTIAGVISSTRLNVLLARSRPAAETGRSAANAEGADRSRRMPVRSGFRWVWVPLLVLAWYFSEPLQGLAYAGVYSVSKVVTEAGQPPSFKLTGHSGPIWRVAWSPDGARVASAADDGTARIWEVAPDRHSGRTIATLTGHTRNVTGVAWSPAGTRLATGALDGTVRVWDSATGTAIATLEHGREVYSVAWSPDGRRLAAAGRGSVSVWDAATDAPRKEAALNDGGIWISRLAWSPDGQRLAATSDGGGTYVWAAATWRQLALLPQENGARDVAWSPDGRQVATVSYEQAYVWDVASGRKLLTLDPGEHTGFTAVESVAWAPDGKRLAVGYEDGAIKLWAADSGRSLGELNAFTSSMYSLAWSPEGQWLASASGSDLQVWAVPRSR